MQSRRERFDAEAAGFHMLIVCEGNICRSALASVLLRDAFRGVPEVTIASAGTRALVGHGMPDEMVAIAERLRSGEGARAHVAAQLDEPAVTAADLVLTAARPQRTAVVELDPSAVRRTFTLREFAHVATQLEPADIDAEILAASGSRAREEAAATGAGRLPNGGGRAPVPVGRVLTGVTSLAGQMRGVVAPPTDDVDIVDPFRRSTKTYEESSQQTLGALKQIISVFGAALERARR